MINVYCIWDFDGPIGQVNASLPYNFNEERFGIEIDNVKFILKKLEEHQIKNIFAITGFTAENSATFFNQRELIKDIHSKGHEIASHSWRHEWLPLFTKEQITRSLRRSKMILEECIGVKDSVTGFVPPHNRPMTWIRKGAYSKGDRGLYPFFWGGDLGNIITALQQEGYKWIRISNRAWVNINATQTDAAGKKWYRDKLKVVQNTYTGFDDQAIRYINDSVKQNKDIVISGHPLAFIFGKSESKDNFLKFLETTSKMVASNQITFSLLS
jgi:peptidoglycan/xylan/chitin deacetylase (PgdA/CDA1 family)